MYSHTTYKRSELGLSKELRHKLFHHDISIDDYKCTPIGRPRACRGGFRIACIFEHFVEFVRKCDELLFCVSALNSGSRLHIITNCDAIIRYHSATCNVVGCGWSGGCHRRGSCYYYFVAWVKKWCQLRVAEWRLTHNWDSLAQSGLDLNSCAFLDIDSSVASS